MTAPPKFTMDFEPLTIEHLGLRLYNSLPPVISELVSNSHDAESPKVEIKVPPGPITGTTEVVIRDFGHGMDAKEIQTEYLPIGRNRRGPTSSNVMSKNKKVRVTGRKGLGKLSAFGIADEMDVRSFKNGQAVALRLSYSAIKSWADRNPSKPFEPTVLTGKTGPTTENDGLEVRLRKFRRNSPINEDVLRKGLARRLGFIGATFDVRVNGKPIQPGDRIERGRCAPGYSWDVNDLPGGGGDLANGLKVTGWVGFLPTSSSSDRGVDIFANLKAVELGTFFDYSSTHAQYARAYVVGEIHADFLDLKEDLATTARTSVIWESPEGGALQVWGQRALSWAFGKWTEGRRKEKETGLIKAVGFDKWLETRLPIERKAAWKLVKILVEDEKLDPESAGPILEIIKSSVETVAFRDLVDTIETEGSNAATLIRLFDEWRVIEAREHLKLADGRRAAIEQLEKCMREGALEVQEMQPLFEKNLWLLDPTWTEADGQTTYTQLLRDKFKEPRNLPEIDRRLDILGVRSSGILRVVELKHPKKTLSRKDLEQIEEYVDFIRGQSGTGPEAPAVVDGLLVVGRLSTNAAIVQKINRLKAAGIMVENYEDLRHRAREYYGEVEKHLKKVAPEYVSARRQVGVKPKPRPTGRPKPVKKAARTGARRRR